MSEQQEDPATKEDPLTAMYRDLWKAERILEKENPYTWKRMYGRRYRCKREERANDSGEPTGDDLTLMAIFGPELSYERIRKLIASHPDGRFNHLAKYLPKNNTPKQEENTMNNKPQQADSELDGIITAIRNYAKSRQKSIDVKTFIEGIYNSTVLNDVMLRAALRISWLKKQPQLDEASPKYAGEKQNP